MSFCPNCNKELSEDTQFCDSCGTQIFETIFCTSCGQQTSTEYSFCQFCGASLVEMPVEEQPVEMPKPKKKLPKKAILFGAIGVAVVAVLVLVVSLIFGSRGLDNYALYLKDGEIYFNDLGKNSESWQVTKKLVDSDDVEDKDLAEAGYSMGRFAQMSEDGKYLFYPDKVGENGFTLYYRAVNDPEAEAKKIDSGLESYQLNAAGTLVTYTKGDDGDLYQYDVKKDSKEKIASEVVQICGISEDGSRIIYKNSDGNLYVKDAGKDKEKLASEIEDVERVSEDFKTVYYTKEDALYKQVIGEDKEKIASDVHDVIRIYESGEVYYLTKEEGEVCLADYVTDDLKDTDAAITQPDYPTYPSSPDRPYRWEYSTNAQYEAAYAAYENAYEQWQQERDRLDAEYNAAYEAYWDKVDRDFLRDSLKASTISQTVCTLYYYDGKEESVLTESAMGEYSYYYEYALDAAVITYEAYNQSEVEKVKISEVESAYDVEDMVRVALFSSKDWYIAVKDAATVVEQEEVATGFRINDAGTLVYYLDELSESHGELYCITIQNGTVGEAELYDSDVYANYFRFLSDGRLCYYKDVEMDEETYTQIGEMYIDKENIDEDVYLSAWIVNEDCSEIYYMTDWNDEKKEGTLKLYNGKQTVEIDDDVYWPSRAFRVDDSVICYMTEWNAEKQKGTLKIYNGKKAEEIAEEAHDCTILPDGRVLYLHDYSTKNYKGDLYEWNNGKTRKIDDDVIAIIPIYNFRGVYGW